MHVGSILLAFIAILVSLVLIWRSDRKQAAVGRRYEDGFRLRNQADGNEQRNANIFARVHSD